jgi:hypothetical protein
MDDTSMITMDMSGYGYDFQTFACKYNDGILVQTKVTVLDQSAGKPEAIAEGFSGIMRKGDVGVLVHDGQYVCYAPIDIIPESIICNHESEILDDFYMMDMQAEMQAKLEFRCHIPKDDVGVQNMDDEYHPRFSETKLEFGSNEPREVEESFLEFTQSLHTATSKLRKKITHFIHFPKDMKK